MMTLLVAMAAQAREELQPEILERLMAGLAGGYRDPLAALYHRTRAAVYGLALSYLKNGHDAQDVTQDTFVRIDWYGNVQFPQESLQQSLELLHGAADSLTEGNLSAALRKLYEIDNNRYAFLFEQRVYRHFTQYVFSQPKERLKWGYRRIVGYINLYATVKSLLEKKAKGITDYTAEAAFLQGAAAAQEGAYRDLVGSLNISAEEMKRMLRDCLPG